MTTLAAQGPFSDDENIVASISLASLRTQVISLATTNSNQTEARLCMPDSQWDPCWRQQVDRSGRLYVAVVTPNLCNVDIKESAAISGRTLYFIRWIGSPNGACNLALARPTWRLFSVSRNDLPSSGTLTVRLQLQGATDRVAAESRVELT